MINLNLLDIPKGQKAPEFTGPKTDNEATLLDESLDFFESERETFQPKTEETIEDNQLFAIDDIDTEPVDDSFSKTLKTTEEHVESFDEDFATKTDENKGSWVKMLGIAAAVILLLAILYFAVLPLITGGDEPQPETVPQTVETQTPVATETPTQPQSNIPPEIAAQYRLNSAENSYRINLANRLLESRATGGNHQMVVVTDGYAYTSILADSRDAANRYSTSLKSTLGGNISPKLESTEATTVSGRSKVIANFSMRLSETSGSPQAQSFNTVLNDQNFDATTKALGKQHNTRITYLKRGDQSRQGTLTATNYYVRISGTQKSVTAFIGDLAKQFPSVNLLKMSLFTPNATSINSNAVTANLELVFYSPVR
ncbi:MAG: hypothetical protein R3C41_17020 [Calditrichia bacterium]